MKKLIFLLLLILTLGAVAYGHFKYDIFGLNKELQIDKTPLIIEETKKLSEFVSAHFYEEAVVTETKVDKGILVNSRDQVVIIVKGDVRAGFNLSKLEDNAFKISGDTINLSLPQAEIFDVIVNPSNYEIFIEDGKWDHNTIMNKVKQARDRIESDAVSNGILEMAEKSGKDKLTELFKSFGFKVVNFN